MPKLKIAFAASSVIILGAAAFVLADEPKLPISWLPTPFDISVAPGDELPLTITAELNGNFLPSRVEVSPSLQPYVTSITPTTLPALGKGSRVSIDIAFTAATGTPLQHAIEGTLQFRTSGGAILGNPLPVTVAIGTSTYPPDPGEAGRETLEGIDADADGLRDDVQRYIALTYPEEPLLRAGLRQKALSVQKALRVADSRIASREVLKESDRANECLEYLVGLSGYEKGAELRAEILNTEERSRAYIIFNSKLGGTVTSIPTIPQPEACEVTPPGGEA